MSITIEPLTKAAARMGAKVAIGTARTNAEMQALPLALRERAFWSARLESAHLAQGMLDMLKKATSLERHTVERQGKQVQLVMSRDLFIREARKMIAASDYKLGDPAWEGTLLDHRSAQRLGLIYDFNTRQASEYARFMEGQKEGALQAYPAQQLVREQQRMVPRPWRERWHQHGGREFGGRMIALKNDPIWTSISRFGTPFPPFDFNSGMGVEDVSRDDAEACGLIKPDETPTPADVGFNDNLQASVKGLSAPVVSALMRCFGDQAVLSDGTLKWRASLVMDFVKQAVADKTFKGIISLGSATPRTAEAAKEIVDLTGYDLKLTADETRHAINKHGEGNEPDDDQAGLTPQDFALIPDLWRFPDEVLPGNKPNTLVFKKDLDGILTMVTWRMNPAKRTIFLQTLGKKIKSGERGLMNKFLGQNVRDVPLSMETLRPSGPEVNG